MCRYAHEPVHGSSLGSEDSKAGPKKVKAVADSTNDSGGVDQEREIKKNSSQGDTAEVGERGAAGEPKAIAATATNDHEAKPELERSSTGLEDSLNESASRHAEWNSRRAESKLEENIATKRSALTSGGLDRFDPRARDQE